jgi:uncharacterized protein YlxP (DUF503 family)
MAVGILRIEIHLPGCTSLKEKRRRLKPLLARLRREFNLSTAEMDHQDIWQSALVGCAMICNDGGRIQSKMAAVVSWVETNWPDVTVMDESVEIL